MTDDVETRLRSALQYHAERVVAQETQLRSPRRPWRTPMLAAACVLAIVGLGVAARSLTDHRHDRTPVAAGADSFVGRRWLLSSVEHDGRTVSVSANLKATVDFGALSPTCPAPVRGQSCPGAIGINDTLNYLFGTYRLTADGLATSAMGSTGVGYDGRDPVRVEVIKAMNELGYGRVESAGSDGNERVRAAVTGGRLTLTVAGYVMVLSPQGAGQIDTSAPSPTSTT